jgi:hypothetical protein
MATIDKEHVPLLILHWKVTFSFHSSIAEVRARLEENFLYVPRDRGTVHAWITAALGWKDRLRPGIYEKMLQEYHRAKKE